MERSLRIHTRVLAAALGLAIAAADAAEKKDTRPVLDPPPPVMPQNISVVRGRKVDIPLKIYGVQNEPLRFLIKTTPAHGKLSEPRAISREVASVTYEPPADLTITADRFSFSVQNHAGVSAPAEVMVTIVDPPAQLAVPHTIEFGELLAGKRTVREIEIANRGGGVIQGEVEVDPPFQIEGRRNYRLEGGDYAYFKIVFAPSEGGLFRREVRYTSTPEFVTSLVGSAQTPVSAEPTKIQLRHAADSAVRTGAFEIVNRTDEAQTFQIKASQRLQLPATVEVAAQGRTAIAVSTRADVVGDLDEEVRVESPGFSLSVPVHAVRVGPILRVAQRSIALGRVDAARGAQAMVDLQNAGGTAAKVTCEIAAPFSLSETTFDLPAGTTKRLTLNVKPSEPQRYRTWLKFKAGPTSTEVEVEAELIGDVTSERSATARNAKSKTPVRPEDLPPWMPDPAIARAIRVTNITASSAKIQWPLDYNSADHFRAERMMFTRDSARELRNAWVEIPMTTFAREGQLWVASLTGLQPQQSQTVRIVPLNGEGKPGTELFRLDFYTASSRILPKPRLVPTLLITLAVAVSFLFWRRLRRHFSAPLSGF